MSLLDGQLQALHKVEIWRNHMDQNQSEEYGVFMKITCDLFSLKEENWSPHYSGHQKRRPLPHAREVCLLWLVTEGVTGIIHACVFLQKFDNQGTQDEKKEGNRCFFPLLLHQPDSAYRGKSTLWLWKLKYVFESQEGYVTAQLWVCHSHHSLGGQPPLELCSAWLSGYTCLPESWCFYYLVHSLGWVAYSPYYLTVNNSFSTKLGIL